MLKIYLAISVISIGLIGNVPVDCKVSLEAITDVRYSVHEICNNPNGYKVIVETDLETIVVTDTTKLIKSINEVKVLMLNNKPKYINATIYVN